MALVALLAAVAAAVLGWWSRPATVVTPPAPRPVAAAPAPAVRRATIRRPARAPTPLPEAAAAPAPPTVEGTDWSAQMTALVAGCVDLTVARSPGSGIRFGGLLDEGGLAEVGMVLYGDAADLPGLEACVEDRAWDLTWPTSPTPHVLSAELVFGEGRLPAGEPPVSAPPPRMRIEDLPPEERARIEAEIRALQGR